MNILFDLLEAQSDIYNGAAEYAQTVLLKMLSDMQNKHTDAHLFGMYDSHRKFLYPLMSPDNILKYRNVSAVDCHGRNIRDIIVENKIDILFTPCAQYFCDKKLGDIQNLPCRVICVIHDLLNEEMKASKMLFYQYLYKPKKYLRYRLYKLKQKIVNLQLNDSQKLLLPFITSNDIEIITVSDYTRTSIANFFPQYKGRINVWWSPMKSVSQDKKEIENNELANIIRNKERYFLIVSASRPLKNADKMISAFAKFVSLSGQNYKLITVGRMPKRHASHIPLPYISTTDLEYAYQNCQALLYPSLFEGFGYPPLEAMKYGKPILCSNVCSMTEVLGNAPIYFSPVYETDMIAAFFKFTSLPYDELSRRSIERYKQVCSRQTSDLQSLCDYILTSKQK